MGGGKNSKSARQYDNDYSNTNAQWEAMQREKDSWFSSRSKGGRSKNAPSLYSLPFHEFANSCIGHQVTSAPVVVEVASAVCESAAPAPGHLCTLILTMVATLPRLLPQARNQSL